MELAAEDAALAITGGLFIAIVLVAPRVKIEVSRTGRILLLASGVACLGGALVVGLSGTSLWPALAWSMPVFPVLVALLLFADHRRRKTLGRESDVAAPVSGELELLRVRAADPATSGSDLADLAYQHQEVRHLVAANPSTPSSVLAWLASRGDSGMIEVIANRDEGPGQGLR